MRIVILCGGSGTRLWPESRKSLPKQFISLFNEKSLLDLTVERVLKIIRKTKPIFICNQNHGFLVKKTIKKYELDADILLEPVGKNTCASIYLAAKHCSINDNLLIMPSDHLIPNTSKFIDDIKIIESNLTQEQWITLGIKPTKPSEAYGYIQVIKNDTNSLKKVLKFIEKPSKKIATQFVKSDDYYWNAGIFIANTKMIIKSINKYAPDIGKYCNIVFDNSKKKQTNEIKFSKDLFTKIPSRSIDYAVMEKEKNINLYPFNSQWNDIGSWDSVEEIFGDKLTNCKVAQVDSNNNFIRSNKRTIATIGVKDLIIIDSDNATLISKKNHSEKVKEIVNLLLEKNFVEGEEHTFEYRPWGKFENLLNDRYCKVKRIVVSPRKRLSLQYHNFRSEHWLVVSGVAKVHLNGQVITLIPGNSINIPIKSHHYIENKTNEDLIVIETQMGSYFGEDDIIRLDDPYDR